MKGIVYLIGAGPGDYKLITVKGRECIEKADVIIYDYLADTHLLRWARPDAILIYAGKQVNKHTLKQEEINELLCKYGLEGKTVARLKGGDPLVFGRGGEEALALKEVGVPFEFVPGVTSGISAPAYAGIPVTHRAVATSFAIVTGHEDPEKNESGINWEGLATAVDTISFVMGVGNLPLISSKLIQYGRPKETPCAVIRWGTKPVQETVVSTLEHIAEDVAKAKIKPPAIVIVGDVVKYRDQLRWFDNKPLFGKRIVVTRARAQASALTEALEALGAQVIEASAIRTQALPVDAAVIDTLRNVWRKKVIVFTSAEGVRYFFQALTEQHMDTRAIGHAKVCAIGSATAKALSSHGILADIIPADYQAESVVEALKDTVAAGDEVVLVQPKVARTVIPEGLDSLGVKVDVLRMYETVQDESNKDALVAALSNHEVDYITFTSSSTVVNTLHMLGDDGVKLVQSAKVVCIGPITAATCEEQGIHADLIGETFTIPAMVELIKNDAKA